MLKKNYREVEEEQVTLEGSSGTTMRILIATKDGAPRYAMHRFEIKHGGRIGVHEHPGEQEIYILIGKARVFDDEGHETLAASGGVLFVPSYEKHWCENLGNETLSFVCVVPILDKE